MNLRLVDPPTERTVRSGGGKLLLASRIRLLSYVRQVPVVYVCVYVCVCVCVCVCVHAAIVRKTMCPKYCDTQEDSEWCVFVKIAFVLIPSVPAVRSR